MLERNFVKYYKVGEVELNERKLIGIFMVFFLFGLLISFWDNNFYRIFTLGDFSSIGKHIYNCLPIVFWCNYDGITIGL